jgi:hypothetical protein
MCTSYPILFFEEKIIIPLDGSETADDMIPLFNLLVQSKDSASLEYAGTFGIFYG